MLMIHSPGDFLRGVKFLMGKKEPFTMHQDQQSERRSVLLPNFGYGIPFWFFQKALSRSGTCVRRVKRTKFGRMDIDFEFSGRPFTFVSDDMGGAVIRARERSQDLDMLRAALRKDGRFIDRTGDVSRVLREGSSK